MKKLFTNPVRRLTALALTLATILSLCVPTFAASQVISDGICALLTANKSTCVNTQFAARTGANIVVDPFNAESNELWIVRNVGSGYVTFSPTHASSYYLTGEKGKGNGLTLRSTISPYGYTAWYPIKNSDGSYTFRNKGNGLVIDCANGQNSTTGNQFLSWSANGYTVAQSYYLSYLSTKTNQLTPSNRVSISNQTVFLRLNANRSACMNVQYASTVSDKASLVADPYNGESNELFQIINRGNSLVSIHPLHAPSLSLNCLLANPIAGYQITLHTYENGDECSLWEVYRVGDGYSFRNAKTHLMLDDKCAGTSAGTPMIAWSYNGDMAQVFYLESASSSSSSNSTNASNSSTVSGAEAQILQRLQSMMDGTYASKTYKVGTKYTGAYSSEQCKGFAKKVHMVLFGYSIGSTKSKPYNYQISINKNYTTLVGSLTNLPSQSDNALRSLFNGARAGDFIQLRRSHTGSHSMIFLSSDANGFTVFECNLDGSNGISTNTYSWSKFRASNAAVSVYTANNYSLH